MRVTTILSLTIGPFNPRHSIPIINHRCCNDHRIPAHETEKEATRRHQTENTTSSIKLRQIEPKILVATCTPVLIRVCIIPNHYGDLMMSTIGSVQHQCFLSGIIDDAYILFRVVRSFCFMN